MYPQGISLWKHQKAEISSLNQVNSTSSGNAEPARRENPESLYKEIKPEYVLHGHTQALHFAFHSLFSCFSGLHPQKSPIASILHGMKKSADEQGNSSALFSVMEWVDYILIIRGSCRFYSSSGKRSLNTRSMTSWRFSLEVDE